MLLTSLHKQKSIQYIEQGPMFIQRQNFWIITAETGLGQTTEPYDTQFIPSVW